MLCFFTTTKNNTLDPPSRPLSNLTTFFPQIPPPNPPALHPREDSLSLLEHVQRVNGQLVALVDTPVGAGTCPSPGKCRPAYAGRNHAARIAELEVAAV
jgi:hypothetical protein